MDIKSLTIKNYRGFDELPITIDFANFSIFIGNNGTGKTTILEAVNFCLSPGFVAARLDINDFHRGENKNIEITVEFNTSFTAKLADGYTTQNVECNKVSLIAKKRERSAPGKAFSDLVTISHYVVPVAQRGKEGWSQPRQTSSNNFKFTERQLSFPNVDVELPRVFYFSKTRNKQLIKGFASSFTNIINDLNWRFDQGQRGKEEADHFKHERNKLHKKVISATDGDTLKRTIASTNTILKKLGIEDVDLSILKTLTPYDHSEIVFPFDGFELPVDHGGSGIEMGIAIAFLEAMAKISKEKIILVIDEPELHLHPKLQDKLFDHLKEISSEIQIIVSTHSPFLYKNVYGNKDIKLLVSTKNSADISIKDARASGFGLLKWSPSWGEICHFAFDIATIEFHDDLYCSLQDRERKDRINDMESWFVNKKGFAKEIRWVDTNGTEQEETLMTYIRNRIHHGDNLNRPMYAPEQLKESIERMIGLLKNP
jgi:predicted ATP-dependent endonuclease of OLD family